MSPNAAETQRKEYPYTGSITLAIILTCAFRTLRNHLNSGRKFGVSNPPLLSSRYPAITRTHTPQRQNPVSCLRVGLTRLLIIKSREGQPGQCISTPYIPSGIWKFALAYFPCYDERLKWAVLPYRQNRSLLSRSNGSQNGPTAFLSSSWPLFLYFSVSPYRSERFSLCFVVQLRHLLLQRDTMSQESWICPWFILI